jgi:hypothetical protein
MYKNDFRDLVHCESGPFVERESDRLDRAGKGYYYVPVWARGGNRSFSGAEETLLNKRVGSASAL